MCVSRAADPKGAASLSPFILSPDRSWISIRKTEVEKQAEQKYRGRETNQKTPLNNKSHRYILWPSHFAI